MEMVSKRAVGIRMKSAVAIMPWGVIPVEIKVLKVYLFFLFFIFLFGVFSFVFGEQFCN